MWWWRLVLGGGGAARDGEPTEGGTLTEDGDVQMEGHMVRMRPLVA